MTEKKQIGSESGLRNREESEVFGWSRIPSNIRCRILLSDSGIPIESFFTSHS